MYHSIELHTLYKTVYMEPLNQFDMKFKKSKYNSF